MNCPRCDKEMCLTGESGFYLSSNNRWWKTKDYWCDDCRGEVETTYPSKAVEHEATASAT